MGGLMHLFDFNQSLSGRKLPSDRKSRPGSTPPKKNLDVKRDVREAPQVEALRSEDSQALSNVKTSRKSNGIAVKIPIKQESLEAPDVRNHAPSVVARLMGLDALPMSSKTDQKSQSTRSGVFHKTLPTCHKIIPKGSTGKMILDIDEKPSHRVTLESNLHQRKSSCNAGQSTDMVRESVITGQHISSSHEAQQNYMKGGDNGSGTLPSGSRSHEKQLEKFKDDFDASQRWQTGYLKTLSWNENAPPHQKHQEGLTEKHKSPSKAALEGRHKESNEFQDAMDFLQANKDFFVKFIHGSKFFCTGHDQEECTSSNYLSYPSGTVNAGYLHPIPDESLRSQGWTRDIPMSRMDYRSDSTGSSTENATVDTNEYSIPESPLACSEQSLGYQQHANYRVPTRIVVLKPSPGRARNLKPSPSYPHVPKGQVAKSTVPLLNLLEKLRKDKEHEYDIQSALPNADAYYGEVLNDRKEVAREIARRARGMMGSVNAKNVCNISDQLKSKMRNQDFWLPDANQEDFTTIDRRDCVSLDHLSSSMLLDQTRKLNLESVGRKDRTDVYHQSRETVAGTSDKIIQRVDTTSTNEDAYSLHCSPELRNSRGPNGFERPSLYRVLSKERYRRALFKSDNIECVNNSPDKQGRYVERINREPPVASFTSSSEQSQEGPKIFNNRNNLGDIPIRSLETVKNFVQLNDEIIVGANTGTSDLKVDQTTLEDDDSVMHKQSEELPVIHMKQLDPDSTAVQYFHKQGAYESDKKLIQNGYNDTIRGLSDECEAVDKKVTSLLDNSHNNRCGVVEESEAMQPSVKTVSLIGIRRTVKAESEQPSPVSILDFPYDDEALLSRENKEIKPDLQGRQSHLHFDDGHDDEALHKDFCLPGEEFECDNSECNGEVLNNECHRINFHLEESNYSSGKEAELAYVRDLFVSVIERRTPLTPWNAPYQLVNPDLFENMESYLDKVPSQSSVQQGALSLSQRRLLFDTVNEILFNIAETHLTSKSIPSDMEIFKHVGLHIDRLLCSYSDDQWTVVTSGEGRWFDKSLEIDELGLVMEKAITDDLIEELLLVF